MIFYEDIFFEDEEAFNKFIEALEDFPQSTRQMYHFARRRHNDTGAIRKVSKQPYWVHPEGVARLVMEFGGNDLQIKIALAHDTMEDAGAEYDDLVEKFGKKVADIVQEVTNDKEEIARIGKEEYTTRELLRLSPEALTVKLADMNYNLKDSCTDSNLVRMKNNLAALKSSGRPLKDIHKKLLDDSLDFAYDEMARRHLLKRR